MFRKTGGLKMECEKCGSETGKSWKKLCLDCYKKQQRDQKDRNMLNSWRAGNIQNDLCFAEDNEVG